MRVAALFLAISASIAAPHLPAQTPVSVPVSSLAHRAESGDAQAQFELARAYEDGKGLPQDDAKAAEWFRKSAEQGNAQAQNSLGVMYALGRGVNRDREESVGWYRKAAKQGLDEAMYNIAIAYYNGEGAEENTNLACMWMMAAQRMGDGQAAEALKRIQQEFRNPLDRCKMDLANMYEKGDEIPADMQSAAALYKEIGQQDRKQSIFAGPAQFKLCQFYVLGKGVPQDYAEAKSWCRKTDNAFASVVLGRMAEQGLGQPKSVIEAVEYYRKAAMGGERVGFMESARMRLENGTHNGEKQAYFWYAIAAKLNCPGAAKKLQEVVPRLSDKELAEQSKLANDWFKLPVYKRPGELKRH